MARFLIQLCQVYENECMTMHNNNNNNNNNNNLQVKLGTFIE